MPQKKSQNGQRKNKRAGMLPSASVVPRPIRQKVGRAQLVYNQFITMTESASGVGAFNSFRLNDLYDPDFTGTGQQPVAFDQYSLLYSRFRVLSTTVRIQLANQSQAVASGTVIVGVFPSSSSTLPAAAISWPCQPFSQCKMLAIATGGPTTVDFRMKYDIAGVLGLRKQEYNSDMDFTCTPSNSPLRPAFLHVFVFSQSGTIGIAAGTVTMLYEVELSQPVLNSMS